MVFSWISSLRSDCWLEGYLWVSECQLVSIVQLQLENSLPRWFTHMTGIWCLLLAGEAGQKLLAEGLSTSSHGPLHKAAWSSTQHCSCLPWVRIPMYRKRNLSVLKATVWKWDSITYNIILFVKQSLSLSRFKMSVEEEEVIRKNVSSSLRWFCLSMEGI